MNFFEVSRPVTDNFFDWVIYLFVDYFPLFLNGIKFTLLIAFTGTIFGIIIGLFVGAIRAIKMNPSDSLMTKISKRLSRFVTSIYVEVFRGTPMMVQALFIYYSMRPFFGGNVLFAGIFVVSVNTGAYMAEIIRAGIQSVPSGQSEAALTLGMTGWQSMLYVILPQAIRNAFPAIGNEFVVNIKDSCVLNVISVTEIFFQASSVAGTFYKYEEAFFIAAMIYLTLTFITTRILALIEKRLDMPTNFTGSQTVPEALTLRGEK